VTTSVNRPVIIKIVSVQTTDAARCRRLWAVSDMKLIVTTNKLTTTTNYYPQPFCTIITCVIGVTHARDTCTRNLHRCTWPKLCGLISLLCLLGSIVMIVIISVQFSLYRRVSTSLLQCSLVVARCAADRNANSKNINRKKQQKENLIIYTKYQFIVTESMLSTIYTKIVWFDYSAVVQNFCYEILFRASFWYKFLERLSPLLVMQKKESH